MRKYTTFIAPLLFMAAMLFNIQGFSVKHVVLVGNYYFNPSSLNVSVGDTMRWVWSAGSHTTTSGVIPGGAASWDQPINSTNTVYEYPVTVTGTYNYVCTPHAAMGMIATFTATTFVPTLSVSPSNRSVAATQGSTTFTVTSNSTWTSASNAGWCTVTTGGTGNGTISANYSANTGVTQRVATITVTVSGLPAQTVTVTQAGAAPTLTVAPSNQNVAAQAGATAFTVTSNTSWTSVSDASWCTVTPSGSGNGTLTATYTVNPATSVRVATITTTVAGLTPQSVTVTQAASTVGVNEENLSGLLVFPSPTRGIFTLDLGNYSDQAASVSIMDMSGKNILSRICTGTKEYRFDLSGEPKGEYLVRITIGSRSAVKRISVVN